MLMLVIIVLVCVIIGLCLLCCGVFSGCGNLLACLPSCLFVVCADLRLVW